MSRPTIGENVRRNTRSSLLVYVLSQGLKFVLFPIVIASVEEGYALVRVSWIFFSYLAISQFGVGTAFMKYTAECHAKGDYERLSRLLSTGVALCLVFGSLMIFIVLVLLDRIVGLFPTIPAEDYNTARFVFGYVAVMAVISIILGAYRSALVGIQRIDLVNNCRLPFAFLEFAVLVPLLWLGFGVRTVVVMYGVTVIGPLVVMMLLARRHLPDVHINPLRPSRDSLVAILSLGGRMQVLGFLALSVQGVDSLVLFRYEALGFTVAYMAVRTLVQRIQAIPTMGFGSLSPASADMNSRDQVDKALRVFLSAQRVTILVAAYFLVFMAVNCDLIVAGYIGLPAKDQAAGTTALLFLSVAAILHTTTGPLSSMLRGVGKPLLESCFHVTTLTLFGAAFYFGRQQGHPELILLAFPVAIGVAAIVYIMLGNRHFGAPIHSPFGSMFLLIAVACGLAMFLRFLLGMASLGPGDPRQTVVVALICMGILYTGLYAVAVWFLPGLKPQDKDQLVRLMPYGSRILAALGLKEPLAR